MLPQVPKQIKQGILKQQHCLQGDFVRDTIQFAITKDDWPTIKSSFLYIFRLIYLLIKILEPDCKLHNPSLNDSFINRMAFDVSLQRDNKLCQMINDQLAAGHKNLIIYGKGHFGVN